MERVLALTGFGAFEEVGKNPSAALARALGGSPPAGWRVRWRELPVSFARAPELLETFLGEPGPAPALLLALGVHREPGYRLERRALGDPRPERAAERRDVDGRTLVEAGAVPGDHCTVLELEPLARALAERTGARVLVSDDAGGYVCERAYHRLLALGERLAVPALFVHVPPLRFDGLARQEEVLRALLALCGEALG